MNRKQSFNSLYRRLLSLHGCQGWWPISIAGSANGRKDDHLKGYHPADYSLPETDEEKFEICLGAILTQNTSWKNVPPALKSLWEADLFSPDRLAKAEISQIALAIKRCGVYNQKASYLKYLALFLQDHPFVELEQEPIPQLRDRLLKIKGVGPETADCIVLYALKKCSFVIDAYTIRIFTHLGMIDSKTSYHKLKAMVESELEQDLALYQEYHALLVRHGKLNYSRKPYGSGDPLLLPS